jgi:hypothetical protein
VFDVFYSKGRIEKKTHKLQDNPLKLEKREREWLMERGSNTNIFSGRGAHKMFLL